MTYNIHWGVGTDGEYNLDRIADVIKAESPDIVLLQEVHDCTSRFNDNQTQIIANKCGISYWIHAPTMQGYPHIKINDFVGSYGNAILSNIPFDDIRHVRFTQHKGYSISQEPRAAVGIHLRDSDIWIWNCHLGADILGYEQSYAVQEWLDACSHYDGIIGGDFNAMTWRAAYKYMISDGWSDSGGYGWTYPTFWPLQKIDYIFLYFFWKL